VSRHLSKVEDEDWTERKPSIVFECENIQETFAAVRDRGVKFIQEPKAMPWGWFAMFVNNDGCLPNTIAP
jgi:lactoylglutathione lyase